MLVLRVKKKEKHFDTCTEKERDAKKRLRQRQTHQIIQPHGSFQRSRHRGVLRRGGGRRKGLG